MYKFHLLKQLVEPETSVLGAGLGREQCRSSSGRSDEHANDSPRAIAGAVGGKQTD